MEAFYRDVLGLQSAQLDMSARRIKEGYGKRVSFLTDGEIEMHLSTRDLALGSLQGHFVNPQANGHIAFRTDDIAEIKRRLTEHHIVWSDWGEWAIKGWYQVFAFDPSGNVIEIHQAE
jgi:catechol 2,3-dioxygenase-like lactoylglutathione lyase family enzyme